MSFLQNCQDIDTDKKQCRILIFGDIVLKFERGFVKCCDLAPMSNVFLSTPAIATIISIQSKTEHLFSEKQSFHFHCVCLE